MTRTRSTAPASTSAAPRATSVPVHFRPVMRAQNTPAQMPERFRDMIRREEQARFLDKMTMLDWNVRTVTMTGVKTVEDAPAVEDVLATKKSRWSWVLDSLLSITVPEGHFTFKKAIKRAITKGGIVLAAIAAFAVPAELGGDGLGMHAWGEPESTQSTGARVTQMVEQFECSYSGLPDGVEAKHAIVQAKNGGEDTASVVSFDKGWDIYNDKDSARYLVAVCAK